jgi:hypothetical protein
MIKHWKQVQENYFYADKNEAIKQLGAGGLNKIVSLDDCIRLICLKKVY